MNFLKKAKIVNQYDNTVIDCMRYLLQSGVFLERAAVEICVCWLETAALSTQRELEEYWISVMAGILLQ